MALVVALALVLAAAAGARDGALGDWRHLDLPGARDQRVVSEREWAARLVQALGLEPALPPDHDANDLYSLLCPERAERVVRAEGRRVASGLPFTVSVDRPRASGGAPLRVVVGVPATALYALRVTGEGHARWSVDRRDAGSVDPSLLGVDVADTLVPLARGPHEIEAVVADGSEVERIELTAFRPLCIAPAGGWDGDAPLRFSAKARTMVRAFGLEGRLPAEGEPRVIEGEAYRDADANARRIHEDHRQAVSGGGWAEARGGPAELSWRVRLAHPGLFSVVARVSGDSRQLWSVDDRHELRLAPEPSGGEFAWAEVATLPLDAGEHVLRARIAPGAAVDLIHLVKRRTRDQDYLDLLEGLGFREGAASRTVSADAASANLRNPTFDLMVAGLLKRIGGGPGDPIAVLADELERHYQRPLSPLLPADFAP